MYNIVKQDYEIIYQTDLIDCYRIKDGVLLNVKKYIVTDEYIGMSNTKPYHKNCNDLRVLKKEYIYNGNIYSIGTVIDSHHKVEKCNVNYYTYEIKTTGKLFYGKYDEINNYIDTIKYIMNTYKGE